MTLERLRGIVKKLRGKDGCPWDRRQTHGSLKSNLVEETYEVLEAIRRKSPQALEEELGDLLMQIVFHASIEEERGRFTIDGVIRSACRKLIRRHPHVFARGRRAGTRSLTRDRALSQWESLKHAEKPKGSGMDGIPVSLPALQRAARVQSKAARLGFEWSQFSQAMDKLEEELREFKSAVRRKRRAEIRHELGDAIFALAKVARFLKIDPEDTLQAANDRFIVRFRRLERAVSRTGRKMHEVEPEKLYKLWRQAK